MATKRLHRNSDPVFDLYIDEVAKTANYTIVSGDNGKLFTNLGAAGTVIFTLPALAVGPFKFGFLVVADFTVQISSAEGANIVAFNNASANSLAFSTGGAKIGGHLEFFSNADGTKWYVKVRSTNTITVA